MSTTASDSATTLAEHDLDADSAPTLSRSRALRSRYVAVPHDKDNAIALTRTAFFFSALSWMRNNTIQGGYAAISVRDARALVLNLTLMEGVLHEDGVVSTVLRGIAAPPDLHHALTKHTPNPPYLGASSIEAGIDAASQRVIDAAEVARGSKGVLHVLGIETPRTPLVSPQLSNTGLAQAYPPGNIDAAQRALLWYYASRTTSRAVALKTLTQPRAPWYEMPYRNANEAGAKKIANWLAYTVDAEVFAGYALLNAHYNYLIDSAAKKTSSSSSSTTKPEPPLIPRALKDAADYKLEYGYVSVQSRTTATGVFKALNIVPTSVEGRVATFLARKNASAGVLRVLRDARATLETDVPAGTFYHSVIAAVLKANETFAGSIPQDDKKMVVGSATLGDAADLYTQTTRDTAERIGKLADTNENAVFNGALTGIQAFGGRNDTSTKNDFVDKLRVTISAVLLGTDTNTATLQDSTIKGFFIGPPQDQYKYATFYQALSTHGMNAVLYPGEKTWKNGEVTYATVIPDGSGVPDTVVIARRMQRAPYKNPTTKQMTTPTVVFDVVRLSSKGPSAGTNVATQRIMQSLGHNSGLPVGTPPNLSAPRAVTSTPYSLAALIEADSKWTASPWAKFVWAIWLTHATGKGVRIDSIGRLFVDPLGEGFRVYVGKGEYAAWIYESLKPPS